MEKGIIGLASDHAGYALKQFVKEYLDEGLPFFKILLSHDPSHWRRSVLPDTDIQITLSGHTHGGQLLIGGFHPISLVSSEWAGTYREGPRMLFVSTGLGEALFTFRYGVWPEIDVLTLQKRS